MKNRLLHLAACGLLCATATTPAVAAQAETPTGALAQANASLLAQTQASVEELARLREQIAAEQIPLSRELSELETELLAARAEFQEVQRTLDGRTVDLSNLSQELEARRTEVTYLSNLLGEYGRNFFSRLHVAETQRYAEPLERGRLAPETAGLTQSEVFAAQAGVVQVALERLLDAAGGTLFEGSAVDPQGLVQAGTFALLGPLGLFRTEDGVQAGTVEQRMGSLEPTLVPFVDPALTEAAAGLVATGAGSFPVDPTLGNAHKISETQKTVLDEVRQGGLVMWPIFGLAGLSLLIALYRWIGLTFTRMPSQKRVRALFEATGARNANEAISVARAMRGPGGRMLAAGAEHLGEPTELIEEVMYERLLDSKLKLQRMLPFIAISAAAAPLLGLLGTVTGIIRTFQMITVYGSGDVKTLSGGISEALITTKYGLVVAIPSLLLHAFLSRKARNITGRMETLAMSFVNKVGVSWRASGAGQAPAGTIQPTPDPELVRTQVQHILAEMLGEDPVAKGALERTARTAATPPASSSL